MVNAETNNVKLYRIENPNIPASPNGITSHEDLVGQWFSPDLNYVTNYLPKSTQTFGRDSRIVDGAQLVVAEVSPDRLEGMKAQTHEIASRMDIESGNYIVPRDGTVSLETIPLDEVIGELRGGLNRFDKLTEARQRIIAHLGRTAQM